MLGAILIIVPFLYEKYVFHVTIKLS